MPVGMLEWNYRKKASGSFTECLMNPRRNLKKYDPGSINEGSWKEARKKSRGKMLKQYRENAERISEGIREEINEEIPRETSERTPRKI